MKRLVVTALFLLSACGGGESADEPVTLTLIAHESFTPSDGIFDQFTEATGIAVEVINAGDAGEIVTKAALTSGNPEGDVLWGVDNTLLSRALEANVFESYEANGLAAIPSDLRDGIPNFEVTPVDSGDVCINYDIAWYDERGIEPPSSFEDLVLCRATRCAEPPCIVSRTGIHVGHDCHVRRGRLARLLVGIARQ